MAKLGPRGIHANDVALHEGKLVAGLGEAAPGCQKALVAELQGDRGIAVDAKIALGPSPGRAERSQGRHLPGVFPAHVARLANATCDEERGQRYSQLFHEGPGLLMGRCQTIVESDGEQGPVERRLGSHQADRAIEADEVAELSQLEKPRLQCADLLLEDIVITDEADARLQLRTELPQGEDLDSKRPGRRPEGRIIVSPHGMAWAQ